MFDYKDPLDPASRGDSAREIARLTRLLGEAYINNASLLEVCAAANERADEATAAALEASDQHENTLINTQRRIADLKTERDALRLRAETAEDTVESYKKLYEGTNAKVTQLIAEIARAEKVEEHNASLTARIAELERAITEAPAPAQVDVNGLIITAIGALGVDIDISSHAIERTLKDEQSFRGFIECRSLVKSLLVAHIKKHEGGAK